MENVRLRRRLTLDRAAIRFAQPFRITGYVFESMPSIIATIDEGGLEGRGESAGIYYLSDDQDHMVLVIESVRDAIEQGLTREELQILLPSGGARNALDCALWELEARTSGRTVWDLAGVSRPRPLVTTFTLPADDPSVLADKVQALAFAKAIKLKLDGDIDIDRERIAVVRSARPEVWLGVDANQGFTADGLDELGQVVREHRVALVEQPLKRGDEAALDGWKPGVPVAADESILDLAELDDRARWFDVINIKLDKCGGLTEALAMERAARAMGKQVMVGNMGGSTLAMAPAFVLAQLCEVVDLDGPYGLADDPLAKDIYSNGEIMIDDAIWGG